MHRDFQQPERFDPEPEAHGREPVHRVMKSVLVSGASGFLGSSICRTLASQGVSVRALVRDRRKAGALEQFGIEAVTGDVTDPATLETPVKGVDTIIHSAALIGPPSLPWNAFEAVNVAGTRNLRRLQTQLWY
ncbi:MAG: NAD(P)H-binding protein [Acidobacteriaceae bacterium]|nr:NAD(P)H-binding protein [Acidobacteriaceae bacterium]MBV9306724.1 NAD(P)H-binding protein [Acidobacteriaceae bacterium]